jgi:DNA invertase Pin-like site-specific DNA recombinase
MRWSETCDDLSRLPMPICSIECSCGMRGYGFRNARLSTEGQSDSGLGLHAQRAAIEAAAARHQLALGEMFTDAGLSGALELEDRPGLFAAVHTLKRGDVLIVAKRDRLGRDVIAVAMIDRLAARKGARILSAAGEGTEGNDPASMLQRRILDAFSEYERLIIGARTKAALKAKRARGEAAGNVPFGYRLKRTGAPWTPTFRKQHVLSILRELRQAGYTLRAIAAELNAQGLSTRRGSAWRRHEYVARLAVAA